MCPPDSKQYSESCEKSCPETCPKSCPQTCPKDCKESCPPARAWNPRSPQYGVQYPAVYRPHQPHALYHLHPVFKNGTIYNHDGNPVPWESLRGLSVALYFGGGNIRRCRNFLPYLTHFYRTINENSQRQKVEVIYVPLDEDATEFETHRRRMPWLSLHPNDPIIPEIKQHFGVFTAPQRPRFGYGPRVTPPHLVVVAADGRSMRSLTFDMPDENVLSRWNYTQDVFA